MARIVKLNELLPDDIIFEDVSGTQYTFPGDPPLTLILRIAKLQQDAQQEAATEDEIGIEMLEALNDEILQLLRLRDDKLTESPFGVYGVLAIVGKLFEEYGVTEAASSADPPKPPTRKKSRSSSGSRSS